MDAISYDPDLGTIAIESGATILKAYQVTYARWGVVPPAGFCYSVAMGGHVSGGAWGPLCRLHGGPTRWSPRASTTTRTGT